MNKYYLTPATLPDWSDYFSQVAVIEKNGIKTIYIAGQVGVDRHKNLVGNGELRGQLKQTFSNLQAALESVDATMANIVKINYTHVAEEGGFDLTKYPAIQSWLDRIASEPKYIGMN